jgi:hypothetical protein
MDLALPAWRYPGHVARIGWHFAPNDPGLLWQLEKTTARLRNHPDDDAQSSWSDGHPATRGAPSGFLRRRVAGSPGSCSSVGRCQRQLSNHELDGAKLCGKWLHTVMAAT